MNTLLQRHYRAPRGNGSGRGRKETTKTSLPQLVDALLITSSSITASSPHVDLAAISEIKGAFTNRRVISWRERQFPCGYAVLGVGCVGHVRPRTGVPGYTEGCIRVYRGVHRSDTAVYCRYLRFYTAFTAFLTGNSILLLCTGAVSYFYIYSRAGGYTGEPELVDIKP